jgi:hypothetical protein
MKEGQRRVNVLPHDQRQTWKDAPMTAEIPSIEMLRNLLRYVRETGTLFWKPRTPDMFSHGPCGRNHNCQVWNSNFANKPALNAIGKAGYRTGRLLNINLRAHRVVFAMHYDRWPSEHIDHINGITWDNRLENLREATRGVNMKNTKKHTRNTSGYCGVSWDKGMKSWVSYINSDGKREILGYFDNPAEAARARADREQALGFTKSHGKR